MHLHVFISLRSFSPTLFLLDAVTRLKISPVFLNVPPYKLHLFQQNKIFSHIKAELLFQGHFPISFFPQHLFLLFFITVEIQSGDMGKREGSATDCPVATSKGVRMKIQELTAGVPAPNPGPPLPSVQSPAGMFCPAQARQPLLPLRTIVCHKAALTTARCI